MDDLIEGLLRLMNADNLHVPVNLGNPEEISMLTLAENIVNLTGSSSRLVFRPLPQDDPTQRCPDITRARQHLDWQPYMHLEAGLRHTITYFDNLLLSGTA